VDQKHWLRKSRNCLPLRPLFGTSRRTFGVGRGGGGGVEIENPPRFENSGGVLPKISGSIPRIAQLLQRFLHVADFAGGIATSCLPLRPPPSQVLRPVPLNLVSRHQPVPPDLLRLEAPPVDCDSQVVSGTAELLCGFTQGHHPPLAYQIPDRESIRSRCPARLSGRRS
jgi:hypothetical protein